MKNTFRLPFALIIASVLLFSMCKNDNNPVQSSQTVNPFIGSWKLVKFDGSIYSGNTVWIFSDTSISISTGSSSFNGSYSYNPSLEPKTIDIKIVGATPNPNLGIYKIIEPDSLILKLMDGATNRPTNFSVEANYDLQEFKKQ